MVVWNWWQGRWSRHGGMWWDMCFLAARRSWFSVYLWDFSGCLSFRSGFIYSLCFEPGHRPQHLQLTWFITVFPLQFLGHHPLSDRPTCHIPVSQVIYKSYPILIHDFQHSTPHCSPWNLCETTPMMRICRSTSYFSHHWQRQGGGGGWQLRLRQGLGWSRPLVAVNRALRFLKSDMFIQGERERESFVHGHLYTFPVATLFCIHCHFYIYHHLSIW